MSSTVTIPSYGHFWLLRKGNQLWELSRDRLGVTYKAVDPDTGTNVALKVLSPALLADDAVREQFFGEASRLSKVVHPNMTAVVDYGAEANEILYVTEFVPGETLDQHVRRAGSLRPKAALKLLRPIAVALTDAGQLRLQHTALNPARILTASENTLKLAEFGLAKSLWTPHGPNDWGHLLDPAYASPEQFRNEPVDPRSDIYSLGVTLWFLCTGRPPFTGSEEDLAYQHQNAELPEAALARCPRPLVELFERMLAKQPAERFEDMPDFVRALDTTIEELSPSPVESEELRVPKKRSRPWLSKRQVDIPVSSGARVPTAVTAPAAPPVAKLPLEREQAPEPLPEESYEPSRARRSSVTKWLIAATLIFTVLGLGLFSVPYALPWLRQRFPQYFESSGFVSITSDPAGATVSWEGHDLGHTPLAKSSLPVGSHVLRVSAPGYKDHSVEVSVKAGSESELQPVSLEKALGSIEVTTDPPGISFQVVGPNGISISGQTPANLRDLGLGDYRVTLHRLGWGDYQEAMTVNANDPVLVSHHYEARGTLKVTADEAGTMIMLDGTSLGPAPQELPLGVGNHTIAATKNGNQAAAKQIEVIAGQASAIEFAAPPPPVAETTLWVPGEGNPAATPSPTPAPTPKAEQAALFPSPTPRRPATQRRLVAAKPRPTAEPTPTPTLEQRRQLMAAKDAKEQATLKRTKEIIDQQIAATTGSVKEAWKYRLAKWQADKVATDAREAADKKALGDSK
jgi:serine/threonine protein kinase